MKTAITMVFAFIAALQCQGQVVELVKDINPYYNNSLVTTAHRGSVPVEFGVVNGRLLFAADDSIHGREMWTSDGTAAGTQLLKDINPLVRSPRETYMNLYIQLNDSIFLFTAFDNVNGWELWRTNATTAGTYMVKDINPGSASSFPIEPEKLGNKVLFFSDDGVHGMEPWITDGTTAGTTIVKDINTGAGNCARLDTNLNTPGYSIIDWTLEAFAYQNKVFFTLADNAYHPSFWVTDGTAAGTTMLANNLDARYNDVKGIGSNCFFYSFDTVQGSQLWMSDGTVAGTKKLTNVTHANTHFIFAQGNTIVYNNKFYFDMDDATHGDELWVSDGTTGGTMMLKDLNTGPGDSYPAEMNIVKGRLYFMANNGTKDILAISDGTSTGTSMFAQFNGNISFMTRIYDYLIIAEKENNTARIWRVDTCSATLPLISTIPADGFSFAVMGQKKNRVYFYYENSNSSGIYVTDGTVGGTVPCPLAGVTTSNPFFYDYFNFFPTFEYNSAFYYTAEYADATGYELYRVRDTTSVMSVTPCNNVTAVTSVAVVPDFQLYPSPAHNRLYWKGTEAVDMMRITNPAGQVVLQPILGVAHSVDISGLSPGVYFVQVRFYNGQTGISRFTKE